MEQSELKAKKEKDILHYEKVRTRLTAIMLVIFLLFTAASSLTVVALFRYESQIGEIIGRLNAVSVELEKLDTRKLVRTTNEISSAVGSAEIGELLESVGRISEDLSEVDIEEMVNGINALVEQGTQSLANADATLNSVNEALEGMDIEGLNQAISDLNDAMEPLNNLADIFG